MTGRYQALVVAVLLATAFAAGWLVNGWRADARIAKFKLAQSANELHMAQQAVSAMTSFQKGFNDALSDFQRTQQGNALAQQDLGRLLLDLRSTTSGLRGDFAGLPSRIEHASRDALSEYASACSAVFEAMAAGGSRLAEAGGELARKAEGHAADVKMMTSAAHEFDRER